MVHLMVFKINKKASDFDERNAKHSTMFSIKIRIYLLDLKENEPQRKVKMRLLLIYQILYQYLKEKNKSSFHSH